MTQRIIHFDLDGVLADFRKSFIANAKSTPEELSTDEMWSRVAAVPEFFLRLEVLESGQALYDVARNLAETRILTALPRKSTYKDAENEKRQWATTNFPEAPFVAVQYARQKQKYAKPGDILIDDSSDNIRRWIQAGGVGIIHNDYDNTVTAILDSFGINSMDCMQKTLELSSQLEAFKRFTVPKKLK